MSIVMSMQNFTKIYQKVQEIGPVSLFSELVCLFVFVFYCPVNKEVMSSWSVNSGTVPGQV